MSIKLKKLIKQTVGNDASLAARVKDLEDLIGDDSTNNTILKRIKDLEDDGG